MLLRLLMLLVFPLLGLMPELSSPWEDVRDVQFRRRFRENIFALYCFESQCFQKLSPY